MGDTDDDTADAADTRPTAADRARFRRLREQYLTAGSEAARLDAVVELARLEREINRETYEALADE